jgi:hypothetical protein
LAQSKNHADVMRDIRKMLKDLEKDQSSFADIFFDIGKSVKTWGVNL